jgi:two-component system chemotaxis response regulator CheY
MKHPIKVLIADDDRTTRSALRLLLGELRLDVIGEAVDGERALEACRTLKPELVFMDIGMPVLDGLTAARHLLADSPDIKIIMITASPTVENLQTAVRSGAGGFVVKPFSAAKVKQAIDQCRMGFR